MHFPKKGVSVPPASPDGTIIEVDISYLSEFFCKRSRNRYCRLQIFIIPEHTNLIFQINWPICENLYKRDYDDSQQQDIPFVDALPTLKTTSELGFQCTFVSKISSNRKRIQLLIQGYNFGENRLLLQQPP